FWVVDNNTMAPVPSFTAKNSSGAVLETVTFQGALVDGHVGVADYGFMGIWAAENIARVEISQDGSLFDNLTFSGVPEPTSLALLAVGAVAVLRRRWRR
ncbi:MAG: PEP-CTERM sorting domain-containing protein, partial [Phycisphaerae bacterium]|nr:PEP-CTERM sorting domain-containing protein [Phycisphaerae bacterium]